MSSPDDGEDKCVGRSKTGVDDGRGQGSRGSVSGPDSGEVVCVGRSTTDGGWGEGFRRSVSCSNNGGGACGECRRPMTGKTLSRIRRSVCMMEMQKCHLKFQGSNVYERGMSYEPPERAMGR